MGDSTRFAGVVRVLASYAIGTIPLHTIVAQYRERFKVASQKISF